MEYDLSAILIMTLVHFHKGGPGYFQTPLNFLQIDNYLILQDIISIDRRIHF